MVMEYDYGCHDCGEVRTYEVAKMGDRPETCAATACESADLYRAFTRDGLPHVRSGDTSILVGIGELADKLEDAAGLEKPRMIESDSLPFDIIPLD